MNKNTFVKTITSGVAVFGILAFLETVTSPVLAAIPLLGWGYSAGNLIFTGLGGDPNTPGVITKGWGWVADPPSDVSIVSGRLTIKFDPSWTIGGYGWLGEFGENPNLPAPPIGADTADENLLQINGNPLMESSSITIDQANGIAIFEYNWGSQGFIPTKNLDSAGHFNFASIYFSDPPIEKRVDFGVVSLSNPYGILGNPQETVLLGENSPTYMVCATPAPNSQNFFCGQPVPEPTSTLGILSLGILGVCATFKRKIKCSHVTEKEPINVG